MNTTVRQPLSMHNSIDRRENKPESKIDTKPFSFIKTTLPLHQPLQQSNNVPLQSPLLREQKESIHKEQVPLPPQSTKSTTTKCSVQDLETFIKEIDRLQHENQKLKEKAAEPQIIVQQDQKIVIENQDLKNQLDFQKQKIEIQDKTHNDVVRQLDLGWKSDVATLKFQMEQLESKHRQALRQEQQAAKQEIARLQSNLTQISSSENKNQNLVQSLEQQMINLKKSNNILEEKLSQAISQFDSQSKDQEFTLMKQQAVISSQGQHVNELKSKLTQQREQNIEITQQMNKFKEVAETKTIQEQQLNNKLKSIESDFEHLSQTYNEHKDQLQKKINELTGMYGKSQEQICLLQQQQIKEQDQIKKLQTNLENEEKNHQLEIADIHKQKQMLIQFLESELLGYKEQNQQLRSVNQKLETQFTNQQQFYQSNFRDLECKTNMLGDECNRLNNIIKQKDEQIFRLQMQLKDLMNLNGKNQSQEELLETLQVKESEIGILKQQNECLIGDLSRQAENYRNLVNQHKQLQKMAEDSKITVISLNEFQSKCELQDREIERLRLKVLEKSQLLEKVQKENLEYQAKLKSKLR